MKGFGHSAGLIVKRVPTRASERVRPRDQRFEMMVKALAGDLFRYALLLCRDRNLAEDLVQQTFLRVWRSLDKLRDENKLKAYLITTLRREHAREYARNRPMLEDRDIEQIAESPRDRKSTRLNSSHSSVSRMPSSA